METRLLRDDTGVVDGGSGLTVADVSAGAGAGAGVGADADAGGIVDSAAAGAVEREEGPLAGSRRNLPSWSRNSLLPELVMTKAARTAVHLNHGGWRADRDRGERGV